MSTCVDRAKWIWCYSQRVKNPSTGRIVLLYLASGAPFHRYTSVRMYYTWYALLIVYRVYELVAPGNVGSAVMSTCQPCFVVTQAATSYVRTYDFFIFFYVFVL